MDLRIRERLLEMVGPFEADSIAGDAGGDGSEAVDGSGEAAAGFDVELPSVTGALEDSVPQHTLRQGPESVGTLVVKSEDAVLGADDEDFCASMLELEKRIGEELGKRKFNALHTSCEAFRDPLRRGNDTRVR